MKDKTKKKLWKAFVTVVIVFMLIALIAPVTFF
jgi:hypothetical protein